MQTRLKSWLRRSAGWIVALGLVVALLGVSTLRASADTNPPNGNFDSNADGWGLLGDCAWDGDNGSPNVGSIHLGPNCEVQSPSMTYLFSSSVDAIFNYKYTGGQGGLSFVMMIDGAIVDAANPPQWNGWATFGSGDFNIISSHILDLEWSYTGDGDAWIDTVQVLGGAVIPTDTPTPIHTPTAPNVSGTQARGQVTSSAATPFFNSGTAIAGAGMFPYVVLTPGANSDIEHLAHIEAVSYRWDFCLPGAVTQIFTDVALCMTTPAISIVEWKWLGVDLLQYLPAVASFLLIVMVIRQIQER